MSLKGKYKKANRFFEVGDYAKAIPLFLGVYKEITNDQTVLDIIFKLVPILNLAKHKKELFDLTSLGIKLCIKNRNEAGKAYLMARKAQFLSSEVSLTIAERQNIILPKNWREFSLERDKKKYHKLSQEIKIKKKKIKKLLVETKAIIKQSSSESELEAHVLIALTHIYADKYLNYKITHINKTNKFLLKYINKSPRAKAVLEDKFAYDRKGHRLLKKYKSESVFCGKQAVNIFLNKKEELNTAYTLVALALTLTYFYDFKLASKYLNKADALSQKLMIPELALNIKEIKGYIDSKNRSIPNYFDPVTGKRLKNEENNKNN